MDFHTWSQPCSNALTSAYVVFTSRLDSGFLIDEDSNGDLPTAYIAREPGFPPKGTDCLIHSIFSC